ncbi:MAG: CDP-glucose 4,6-dehydratase [Ilumatobacteraceae bacterium]
MASLAANLAAFSGRRVLITGHTGFKGSWLSFVLARAGAEVIGVALPPLAAPSHFELLNLGQYVDSRYCDIRDLPALQAVVRESRPEVVFHLAAQAFVRTSYADPYTTFSTNVLGSSNVLECVKDSKTISTLVYVTSDKCYKNKEQRKGYAETDELGGIDPYSVSKAAAEMVFAGYANSAFMNPDAPRIASARAGNVIGGGDWSPNRLIPDCVRALRNNSVIDIRSPQATRPWQHVLEPLSGYVQLAVALGDGTAQTGSSWNFGPPETAIHDVEEVATLVASRWGAGDLIRVTPDHGSMHEAQLLQLNSTKANTLLNWTTRWNFQETMNHTIDWYRAWNDGNPVEGLTTQDIEDYLSA